MSLFLSLCMFCIYLNIQYVLSSSLENSSGASISETLTFVEHALSASCSTTLVPLSTTCYAGVHGLSSSTTLEKRAAETTLSHFSVVNDALSPSCSTVYSTSTITCYAGVHPQPTFSGTEITLTETTSASTERPAETITTTTMAQLSVSAPPASATATSNYTFFITPELQSDIIEIANSFCTGAKQKRDGGGAACRLPQSAQRQFVSQVSELVGDGVAEAYATTLGTVSPQAAGVALGVYAALIFIQGGILTSSIGIKPAIIQSANSIVRSTSTSSSTSTTTIPTLFPGPPNNVLVTPLSQDVIALTEFWESFFKSEWPSLKTTVTATTTSLPCSHGADPQIHSGTAGYCQCTDGKIYPTSAQIETTTISGTKTTYTNDCPYITIPKSTTNLGTTIQPTFATTTTPLKLGSATCFNGAAFKSEDMTDRVSSFCSTASSDKYKITYKPGATVAMPVDNLFQNGQAQVRYTDLGSQPTSSALNVQAKFTTAACKVGEVMEVDFTDFDWCMNNFLKLVNNCDTKKPSGTDYWKEGGMMYNNCIEWTIVGGAS